jgi:hypothetical protein
VLQAYETVECGCEVTIWLLCIGLGEKVERFKENGVTGLDLFTIASEDLTADAFGLDNFQAKKILQHIEFSQSLSAILKS